MAASAARERTLRIAIGVALVLAIAAVYAPVRDHAFVDLDDWGGILWNPDLRVSSLGQALRIAFTHPQVSMWAPLTTLSLQLDWALHGPEPAGFLITNAALHAVSSLLLWIALARLTGARVASAFVAAVFAVHPLHVESVAWASERKDVLSGLFFSLTLLVYERCVRRAEPRGRMLLPSVCLALGLLAKPMLVTLPCVLLLLDFWPLRRLGPAAVREKWPMFALVAVVALITLEVQGATGAMSHGLALPLWARCANAVDAVGFYLAKSFWPTGLAAHYPHPGTALSLPRVALVLAVLLALTALVLLQRRSRPWLTTGWLWFGGMLVPVLGLVQVGAQARADRYTYLPQIGLALALVFGVREIVAGRRALERAAVGIGVLALAALALVSARQVETWRDSETLFEHVAEVSPRSAFPHVRLGMGDAMKLRFDSARAHFARAFEREPEQAKDVVDQLTSMANAHAQLGRPEPAARTARFAATIASETGQPERARELRARSAELYNTRPPSDRGP